MHLRKLVPLENYCILQSFEVEKFLQISWINWQKTVLSHCICMSQKHLKSTSYITVTTIVLGLLRVIVGL